MTVITWLKEDLLTRTSSRKERLQDCSIFLAVYLASVIVILSFGQPINLDSMQYHGYLGWAFWEGRHSNDLMAAGFQGYLAPYLYFPFYFLLNQEFSPKTVCLVLAFFHSANIFLIYRILRGFVAGQRFDILLMGLLLGFLTPVYLLVVGTSHGDAIVTIPFLCSLLLVLEGRKYVLAGALAGVAVALKLTLAPYTLLVAFLFVGVCDSYKEYVKANVVYGLAALFVFMVLYLPWGVALYQQFESPFFPLFNNIIQSPYFPAEAIFHNRFFPANIWGHLIFPVKMALPGFMVYLEKIAPDARYLFFIVIVFLLLFLYSLGKLRVIRKDLFFLVYCCLSLIVWQLTSANGRYGMLPLLLLGVALPIATSYVTSKYAATILLTMVLVQVFSLSLSGIPRWGGGGWYSQWFEVVLPTAKSKAAVYLTDAKAPFASYYRSFPDGSIFVGMGGVHYSKPDSKMFSAIEDKLRGGALLPIRGLVKNNFFDVNGVDNLSRHQVNNLYSTFEVLGYSPDLDSCFNVYINGDSSKAALFSCDLIFDSSLKEKFISRLNNIELIFSEFEARCPSLYSPPGAPRRIENGWQKPYVFTDVELVVADSGLVYSKRWSSLNGVKRGEYTVAGDGRVEIAYEGGCEY